MERKSEFPSFCIGCTKDAEEAMDCQDIGRVPEKYVLAVHCATHSDEIKKLPVKNVGMLGSQKSRAGIYSAKGPKSQRGKLPG